MCEYCDLQRYKKDIEKNYINLEVGSDVYTWLAFYYNENTKEYSIRAEGEGDVIFPIYFCPNCGRKLIEIKDK